MKLVYNRGMFSGIIQAKGRVVSARPQGDVRRVHVKKPPRWKLGLGQSVSVDGICSTVVAQGKDFFEVEYMPETLAKTTAGDLLPGAVVNLERSLRHGDFIDGHFVQGHVDARGRITAVQKTGASRLLTIAIPKSLRRFVAARGSVAVSGVSLTVARVSPASFKIGIIPHTLASTNLGDLKKGDAVNVETDMLARYRVAAGERGGRVGRNEKDGIRKGL